MYEYVPGLGVEIISELTPEDCATSFENDVVCSSIFRMGDAKSALRQSISDPEYAESFSTSCQEVVDALQEARNLEQRGRRDVSANVWSELLRVRDNVERYATTADCGAEITPEVTPTMPSVIEPPVIPPFVTPVAVPFYHKWWFWAFIAGVGAVGIVSYTKAREKKEEEEFLARPVFD